MSVHIMIDGKLVDNAIVVMKQSDGQVVAIWDDNMDPEVRREILMQATQLAYMYD